MENEIWRNLVYNGISYNDLKISNYGRVIGIKGKILKTQITNSGYKTFSLRKEANKSRRALVHRAVIWSFIGNPEGKPEVNHKDGDKFNNFIENLEWTTSQENAQHAANAGKLSRNYIQLKHFTKLTPEDVIFIRENYKNRDKIYGAGPLSKRFNVSKRNIHGILNKDVWKNL